MGFEIQLVVMGICGVIAAAIASSKGRSAVGWFFGGFFLQLIGIIIVAVLSNKKEESQRREFEERERHRLREQLRQERMKNEAFRRYASGRLDSHDQTLGVDTRSPQALPGGPAPALLAASSDPPDPAAPPEPRWYYELNGQTVGPASESVIVGLLRTRTLSAGSLLWSEGLAEWTPVAKLPRFLPGLRP